MLLQCKKCHFVYSEEENMFFKDRHLKSGYKSECKSCASIRNQRWRQANQLSYLVSRAKSRAKTQGVPHKITPEDLSMPTHCPVLGIKLERGQRGNMDNSPSIDKIEPKLGYVPGNVAVISHKANRIKGDATLDELKQVVRWLENNKDKYFL